MPLSRFFLAQYSRESIIRYNGTVQSGYFGTIQSGIYNKVLWHNAVRIFWHNTIKSFEPMVRCFGTEFSSDFKIRFFAQFSQEFIKKEYWHNSAEIYNMVSWHILVKKFWHNAIKSYDSLTVFFGIHSRT